MVDLRAINQVQFVMAKRYWGVSVACKLAAFAIGVWAVFLEPPSIYVPQVLLGLALASEVVQLVSDGFKSRAEAVLRTLDLRHSFARDISEADKRDILLSVPKRYRREIERADDS